MDVSHRLGAESLRFVLCLGTVYSTAFQQFLVHLLEIHCGQLQQWDTADIGCYMVFDESLIGFIGGRANLQFCVILQPEIQPLLCVVLSCLCEIQLLGGFQSLVQLFLNLCLRLASTFL